MQSLYIFYLFILQLLDNLIYKNLKTINIISIAIKKEKTTISFLPPDLIPPKNLNFFLVKG